MRMSYFGRVSERCSRASYALISLAATRTPSGYVPWSRLTVGCNPFQVIRRAHCRTTFRLFSSTPFPFRSSADQQPLDPVVLAVVGRIVHQPDLQPRPVRELDHPLQQLRPSAGVLRAV